MVEILLYVFLQQNIDPHQRQSIRNMLICVTQEPECLELVTKSALYDPMIRGFLPFVDNDAHNIRVLPAKYSVFVAVQMKGSKDIFGPMRFDANLEDNPGETLVSDQELDFWVPIYKLFSGKECIEGLDLDVKLICNHINEKIRRIHMALNEVKDVVTGWGEPDISNPPFVFSEGIAEFSNDESLGSGLLVPVVHNRLVEEAKYQGKYLSFRVPSNSNTLSSSLMIPIRWTSTCPRIRSR